MWGPLLRLDIELGSGLAFQSSLLLERHEGGVAALGRGVDRERALGGEAVEVARAARLGPCAREALRRLRPSAGAASGPACHPRSVPVARPTEAGPAGRCSPALRS